jgi:drug/metabolite transporter (DMT)-like permease
MPAPAERQSALGVALIIGSACCFGSLAIFGKLGYRLGLTLPQLLGYRFALAAILLWAAVAIGARRLPSRSHVLGLVLMGAAGYVGQSAGYFNALRYIPASTTALLLYTYPVVVTLLAALFFGEVVGRYKVAAVGVAFLGTVLVVEAQLKAVAPIGIVLGLSSAVCYSAYILYGSRLLPKVPAVSATAIIMTSAAVVWLGYAGATGQLPVPMNRSRLLLIVAFAIVPTAVPILAFIAGLRLLGPSRAAILSTFEPATTVVLAVIILGETASLPQYIGGALILASVLLLEGSGWRASRVLAQATRE